MCRHLPISIVDSATTSAERDEYVINLLEKILPGSDKDSIADEIIKVINYRKIKQIFTHLLVPNFNTDYLFFFFSHLRFTSRRGNNNNNRLSRQKRVNF